MEQAPQVKVGIDSRLFDPRFMARYLKGAAAEVEYSRASGGECYVMDMRESYGERILEKPNLAEYADQDVVIVPADWVWTLVLGEVEPSFFTYADWV
jgi:hypothetical protein